MSSSQVTIMLPNKVNSSLLYTLLARHLGLFFKSKIDLSAKKIVINVDDKTILGKLRHDVAKISQDLGANLLISMGESKHFKIKQLNNNILTYTENNYVAAANDKPVIRKFTRYKNYDNQVVIRLNLHKKSFNSDKVYFGKQIKAKHTYKDKLQKINISDKEQRKYMYLPVGTYKSLQAAGSKTSNYTNCNFTGTEDYKSNASLYVWKSAKTIDTKIEVAQYSQKSIAKRFDTFINCTLEDAELAKTYCVAYLAAAASLSIGGSMYGAKQDCKALNSLLGILSGLSFASSFIALPILKSQLTKDVHSKSVTAVKTKHIKSIANKLSWNNHTFQLGWAFNRIHMHPVVKIYAGLQLSFNTGAALSTGGVKDAQSVIKFVQGVRNSGLAPDGTSMGTSAYNNSVFKMQKNNFSVCCGSTIETQSGLKITF